MASGHEAKPAHGEHGEEAKFNPGKMIMEHISDAHDWHLWGHTHIPLPVILKTDKGFEFFLSSRFHDNASGVYKGAHYSYKMEENKIEVWDETLNAANHEATHHLYDFSITKNVVTLFIVVIMLMYVFMSIAKAYKRRPGQAPKGMQSFFEPIIIFVRDDLARPALGHKYEKFMPYLLTVFFFIWFSNMLGLIPFFPGGANFTGNITITAALALLTFIITTINGNGHYWRHIFAMPGVPAFVLVILTPIEILGMFLRPFVLMIRLFANISAGHIIALAFYSLIFIFGKGGESMGGGLGVSIVSILFTVFMFAMELLVAFLQAYVFTLLSAIYFGAAVEEHHHEEHDHAHDHAHAAAAH
ncbi:MAG: F0F1 ATP synthase subunit A [Bacteroidetes bacterium]|nr:F0F1 ATP synthase subunit A [Bacteroidota bacterium]